MKKFPERVDLPRTLVSKPGRINCVDLYGFGDASGEGVSAVVYAVVAQITNQNQGIRVSKSRIAKRTLTIRRLELVATHMVTNLLTNVRQAMGRIGLRHVVGWTDSKTALHWIRGQGNYKQYVRNRVKKIQAADYIT